MIDMSRIAFGFWIVTAWLRVWDWVSLIVIKLALVAEPAKSKQFRLMNCFKPNSSIVNLLKGFGFFVVQFNLVCNLVWFILVLWSLNLMWCMKYIHSIHGHIIDNPLTKYFLIWGYFEMKGFFCLSHSFIIILWHSFWKMKKLAVSFLFL